MLLILRVIAPGITTTSTSTTSVVTGLPSTFIAMVILLLLVLPGHAVHACGESKKISAHAQEFPTWVLPAKNISKFQRIPAKNISCNLKLPLKNLK